MGGILGILSQDASLAERKIERSIHADSKHATIFSCLTFNDKANVGMGNWVNSADVVKKEWAVGDWKIVFEGNLYNDQEIKSALEKEGIEIQEGRPAELVLNSFIQWNVESLVQFNGEFAAAIWNEKDAKLYLFRDKIGVKPLYYHWNGITFHFSSELKGITPFLQKGEWEEVAIQQYFRLGYIPSPYTIYKDVHKLTEASILTVELDLIALSDYAVIPEKYWKIEEKVSKTLVSDEKEAKNELKQLISESVGLRTHKQSSFGTFLSGGIDSSLVTAVAQSQSETPISTFSIGFEDSSHNESGYAKEIAEKLGTSHNELILSLETAQELVTKIPEWYEQPYADASAIPSFLVSQMASKEVGMILTGDGGDEQFMGYGMYTWADRLYTIKNSRTFVKLLLQLSPKMNHKRVSQYFDLNDKESVQSHIFSVDQGFFSANSLRKHFHFSEPNATMPIDKTERRLLVSEQQALFDMKYYLPGDLTVKIDRVTEQVNLDARAPLLDANIVEWSLNLDERLKRKGGVDKYLLKQVLFDYLPAELFDRPKWGFGIPLGKWLSSELRPLLEEYVNESELKKHSFYNVKAILELKKQFLSGKSYLSTQLWLVIIFNMWARNSEK